MKTVTATQAECTVVCDADAKLAGLPKLGIIVGQGHRNTPGRGPIDGDWFGWGARWRYAVEPAPAPTVGKTHVYPVDGSLEVALAEPTAEAILTKPTCDAAKLLVAKAVAVVAEPAELIGEIKAPK